jgi:acyl-CoA synthetase (NDP forming)
VVVKALGRLHKSDAGGVLLGLVSRAEVRQAAADLLSDDGTRELSIEVMAPLADGVELILGAKRDGAFGVVVMVGVGGLYSEVLDDVAVLVNPVTAEAIQAQLHQLRGAPMLNGTRGRPPLDVAAAARAALQLAKLLAAHDELAEIEVNPLLVLETGAIALDARALEAHRRRAEPSTPWPQSSELADLALSDPRSPRSHASS